MKVDHALILAAGAGTRMGSIGKRVPKVLWPIFEKTILELEVLYARKIGAKKIFINVHNYKEQVLEYICGHPDLKDAVVLVEEEKIDIGGAIHNMAAKADYRGNLLVLNSDQFIFFSEQAWNRAWTRFQKADVLLFSYEVNSSDLYNGLNVRGGKLEEITPNRAIPRDIPIQTYTGMSLINLDRLKPVEGESRFFESVANPKRSEVVVENIESSPYWDFGTLKRYWDSCFEILKRLEAKDQDLFMRFLLESNALDLSKVRGSTYGGGIENVINLGVNPVSDIREKIIFTDLKAGEKEYRSDGPEFVFDELREKL